MAEDPLKGRVWSPELLALAKAAVERQDAENKKLAAMTPEERKAYVAAWAKRLAEESVAIGERGVGCACCDPDVQAKLAKENAMKCPTCGTELGPVLVGSYMSYPLTRFCDKCVKFVVVPKEDPVHQPQGEPTK